MTQAKIEPGEKDLSLAGKPEERKRNTPEERGDKDILPELGLKPPVRKKGGPPKANPLDRGIDLGD